MYKEEKRTIREIDILKARNISRKTVEMGSIRITSIPTNDIGINVVFQTLEVDSVADIAHVNKLSLLNAVIFEFHNVCNYFCNCFK
jgi:hypothetical protein